MNNWKQGQRKTRNNLEEVSRGAAKKSAYNKKETAEDRQRRKMANITLRDRQTYKAMSEGCGLA